MSLYGSRAQTPDKQIDLQASHTRTSSAFRTTARTTKPSWSNRFVKDCNDLTYDVKYGLIKGKNQLNRGNTTQNNFRNNSQMSKRASSASISSSKVLKKLSDRKDNIFSLIKMNKTVNPQRFIIHQSKKYSTLDSQGLGKHQFQKTIIGKMTHKSNHHMCFEYQSQRSNNVNPVWHNPEYEPSIDRMLKTMKRSTIEKCHDFASNSPHKVFEPRPQLDKFYTTKNSAKKTTTNRVKQTVKIDLISGRKQSKPTYYSLLSYNQQDAKKKTIQSQISHKIDNKIKRELEISRQVISSSRGCYR